MASGRTTVGEVVYKVSLDTSGVDSQAKKTSQSVQQMGDSAEKASRGLDDATKSSTSLASELAQVVAAAAGIKIVSGGIKDVVSAYQDYQSAMMGVTTVARATGNDVAESIQVAKDAAKGGLITEADAAAATKNLLTYGYTAQQAAQMIDVMTNAAAFNRQANYSLSEAVRVTTEGIRMENSILSDAAGVQKNIAKMYDEYAKSIGTTANKLTQAQKAQAVYNGFMKEGGMYAGDAARYQNTLAGANQRLDLAVTQVKQALGSMFEMFAPIISGIADWINENRALVVGIATGVGVMITAAAAFKIVSAAITLVKIATTAALGPIGLLIAALGIIAGIVVGKTIADMGDSLFDVATASSEADKSLDKYSDSAAGAGSSSSASAKQVKKLKQALADLTRDFKRDLKEIGVSHQNTIDDLTKQIKDSTAEYRQAVAERLASFNVTENEEKRKHQEKVDALKNQLNFLQRYNNKYNQEKLAQVRFALEEELAMYKKEEQDRVAELEAQNDSDRLRLEERLAENKKELEEELAFMKKHRDELNSVRDVILLDEIESLQERYDAQKRSYQEQIKEAKESGKNAGAGYGSAYGNGLVSSLNDKSLADSISEAGSKMGEEFMKALKKQVENMWNGFVEWIKTKATKAITGGDASPGARFAEGAKQGLANALLGPAGGGARALYKFITGKAEGGYTGPGSKYEPAGIVHRGEYVIPREQVDQATGTPKLSSSTNITINVSGILATSETAKRDFAMEMASKINQVMKSRSLA